MTLEDAFIYGATVIRTTDGELESGNILRITTAEESDSFNLGDLYTLSDDFDEDAVRWEISSGTGAFEALSSSEFESLTGLNFNSSTGVISFIDPLEAMAEKTFTVRASQPIPAAEATATLKIVVVAP